MSTKMRATNSIKTINKTRRQNILGMTKIPIIYLIKINMSSTKIIMRVTTNVVDNKDDPHNDKRWIL